MESPLNPYRAFILGEIYKAGNELDSVRLEVMIKADIVSKESSQEIINIFNELKEVQENIDLI